MSQDKVGIVVPRAKSITFTDCPDCPNIHIGFKDEDGDIYAEGLMDPKQMQGILAALTIVVSQRDGTSQ